jgi:transposase
MEVTRQQVIRYWLIPIAFSKSLSCRQLCLGIITMHYLEQMSRRPQLPEGFNDVDFQHAARHADDNRECIRLLGLSFIQQGHSVSETSILLKVTNDAVHDWLHRFKEGGLPAMKDQGGRGRKPIIPEESHDEFKDAVLQLQDDKDGGRIVGRDVLKLLEEEFQTECDLRTVYKLLHRVKLSWISGRSKHPKQDLEAQETFKKTSARK